MLKNKNKTNNQRHRVSLHSSDWPGPHTVELPLAPGCWDQRHVPPCPSKTVPGPAQTSITLYCLSIQWHVSSWSGRSQCIHLGVPGPGRQLFPGYACWGPSARESSNRGLSAFTVLPGIDTDLGCVILCLLTRFKAELWESKWDNCKRVFPPHLKFE